MRLGSFTIEEDLGADALGTWYRAVDTRLDRLVRLRVWRVAKAVPPGDVAAARTRVRELARSAAAVTAPSLPTVFALEKSGEMDLISTEWIDGELLADALARGDRWRPVEAAGWLSDIADALAAAHAAGLTHGRVDAHHILLTANGRALLLGLGIATTAEEAIDPTAMRPESDVLALGGVLRQMTTPVPGRVEGDAETGVDSTEPDPGLAVEAEFLDSFVVPALHEEPPRAVALRDALLRATRHANERIDWRKQAERRARERKVDFRAPPTAPAASGPLPILVPDAAEGRRRRVAVSVIGILLGVVLGAGVVQAWRTGTFAGWFEDIGEGADRPALEMPDEPPLAMVDRPANSPSPNAPVDSVPGGTTDSITAGVDSVEAAMAAAPADTSPGTVVAAAMPPPPPPPPPARTATAGVSVVPADAVISRAEDRGFVGLGRTELSVARGDSILLEFRRPGYVPEQRAFRGEPIQVRLVPDSVMVNFAANLPVDVVVEGATGNRRLGTTDLTARLPTGRYTVRYRAEGHDDWTTEVALVEPGRSYRVIKDDYPTRGGLVVTVVGTWALVSLDGGTERESPARFDDIAAGPHVVRLTRPGYESVVDTVRIPPGGTARRQYTIRPVR